MKTFAGWQGSRSNLSKYLQEDDLIDMELVAYILGCVPPVTWTGKNIQMGEPMDTCLETGKFRYMTLEKVDNIGKPMYEDKDGDWKYVGIMPKL